MPRAKTPSFVVELPLKTTAADEDTLNRRLEAARQVYNACLGDALEALKRMRQSRDWQRARAMSKGKERTALFREAASRAGFYERKIEALATVHKNGAFKALLGSDDTQKLGIRAFAAVEEYAFGNRGKPRFKGLRGLHSVEGKKDAVIRWSGNRVSWKKQSLEAIVDPSDAWQSAALQARTKYCRIVRRTIRGKDRFFVQLVQEGNAPVKEKHQFERKGGTVGLDIGPSTIAIVGKEDAALVRFCDTVEQPWREVRRIQRAMDRSRRAMNPDNYNADGTMKRGPKTWNKSNKYKQLAIKCAEVERRLAGERKRAHGELCNAVLSIGDTIKTEKLSYRSFQKSFGRSVKVRAPGLFVSMLRRKAASAGGEVEEFPTRTTCFSQLCHGCGSLVKKPLSLRVHECACGIGPVQRDLYSAFLARHVCKDRLDASQAEKAWPDVEPLLRRAASSFKEPASGRASAAPQVRASERVVRQGREDASSRPRMAYRHVREGRGEMIPIPGTLRL